MQAVPTEVYAHKKNLLEHQALAHNIGSVKTCPVCQKVVAPSNYGTHISGHGDGYGAHSVLCLLSTRET